MKKRSILIWLLATITITIVLNYYFSLKIAIYFFTIIVAVEVLSFIIIQVLRKRSWTVLTRQDARPELPWPGLLKFFKQGYDSELGWTRKPNTKKTEINNNKTTGYSINELGARTNPGNENLESNIFCFGDSFTFSRQVNDNETWPYFLSKQTNSNVQNYGVGNYGIDQALLRLKKEWQHLKTDKKVKNKKIVVMGVVPSTITRILAVWKHYHDFGNTFGFKPVFVLDKNKLKLIENPIDSEDKFLYYEDYLSEIQGLDYFYTHKFRKKIWEFPYSFSFIGNPIGKSISLITAIFAPLPRKRNAKVKDSFVKNLLQKLNLKFFALPSANLFSKNYPTKLLEKIILEFKNFCDKEGVEPVLLWMPQKEDLISIKNKSNYYEKFIESISKEIKTIDLTTDLGGKDLDKLYSDDSQYGGHFSKQGNEFVADVVYNKLKNWKLV